MAHVGAVQRERVARTAQRQRRPRGQPEVRVDDVQASAGEAAAQEPRGARIRERAGWELEQLDLDAGDLPQCRNLVAHEHAASRAFARGGHVRDDQRAHRAHDSGRPSGIMAAVSTPANEPNERPIAVFDSGVGGLTVLQELLVELPQEDFLYLGDTARFPYGERSAEELERFALEIAELLLARRAKLLVVACNAASASALGALQERVLSTTLGVYVTGVIEPESRLAADASANRRIGLLATSATVRSGAYARALAEHAPAAPQRGRLPLPVHRRRRGLQGARLALPADADRARRARRLPVRGGGMSRSYGRASDQTRPLDCVPDFVPPASGSALISVGRTQVICTASVETGVPRWLS